MRIHLLFLLIFSFNCAVSQQSVTDSIHERLLDSTINPSSVQAVVEVLAADSLQGRFTGTLHARLAAEYIASEFKKAGTSPVAGYQGYYMPFLVRGDSSRVGINVLAALPGKSKPEEIVIFCAHYDHVGTSSLNPYEAFFKSGKVKGDSIYNGANDNASGISAVIHLAKYFAALSNNERTILFAAFAGEELGLQGSMKLAYMINALKIVAVINIEMIGRGINKTRKNAYVTGSQLSDLQIILNKSLQHLNKRYGKKFFIDDPFPAANLFQRSDNYWFAVRGAPAHTIMATAPTDKYYHSANDEINTLDFDLMTQLIKAIAIASSGIVAGQHTPSRINKDKIHSQSF